MLVFNNRAIKMMPKLKKRKKKKNHTHTKKENQGAEKQACYLALGCKCGENQLRQLQVRQLL